jgi:anaerobic selenocysteine-containing dehydrogenase
MMGDLDAFDLAPGLSDEPRVFRLVCRRTPLAYNSSCIDASTHRGRLYNPAFLHPDDLAALGLEAGDAVEIASESATVIAIAEADWHLRPGVLSMSFGYGTGSSADEDAVRVHGTNVNVLLRVDAVYDRYSGQPLMSNVPVFVRPVITS